jgi:hypothetical protein
MRYQVSPNLPLRPDQFLISLLLSARLNPGARLLADIQHAILA